MTIFCTILAFVIAAGEAIYIVYVCVTAARAQEARAGRVVWFTGIGASGKTTIARAVETRLKREGRQVVSLDADEVRKNLSPRLGYTAEDRDENVKRLAWTAACLAQQGADVLVAAVSPKIAHREQARQMAHKFVEVHVSCPLGICKERDPKGLYARAAAGEVNDIAGLHIPYEVPSCPEVQVFTDAMGVAECADEVMKVLTPEGSDLTDTRGAV